MESYLHIPLLTEYQRINLIDVSEDMVVCQIDGEEGFYQFTAGAWDYIGGRPPRR